MTLPGRHAWLAASLALNALLLGAVLGGGWMLSRAPAPVAARSLRAAGDGLGAEERARFRTLVRATRAAGRPLLREARRARAAAAAALVAEPYDEPAVRSALARARAADLALRGQREEAVTRFAATLSAADRRMLAAGLGRGMLRAPDRAAKSGDAR